MTREQYISFRNAGTADPLYHFYLERYKGESPLDIEDFFMYIQRWPPAQEAFYRVVLEYDHRFLVLKLTNLKTGELIKYL